MTSARHLTFFFYNQANSKKFEKIFYRLKTKQLIIMMGGEKKKKEVTFLAAAFYDLALLQMLVEARCLDGDVGNSFVSLARMIATNFHSLVLSFGCFRRNGLGGILLL